MPTVNQEVRNCAAVSRNQELTHSRSLLKL